MRLLTSRNRSAQFAIQLCSVLSICPCLIAPVTHLFQQTSVRECTAGFHTLVAVAYSKLKRRTALSHDKQSARKVREPVRLTRLHTRLLVLVGEECAKLLLVLLVELVEIEV